MSYKLAEYPFPANFSYVAQNVAEGISLSDLSIGAGSVSALTSIYPGNEVVIAYNPTGNTTNEAEAFTNNSYLQVTITPDTGKEVVINSIRLKATRGGGATPRGIFIRSNQDNYAVSLASEVLETARTAMTQFDFNIDTIRSTSPVVFRIYGYVPANGQSIDVDDLQFYGLVRSVVLDISNNIAPQQVLDISNNDSILDITNNRDFPLDITNAGK